MVRVRSRVILEKHGCFRTELDGADIQDLGLKHGLIRAVPYDPAVHSDILGVGPEPGDEWFEQIPELADLAAGRRALENSHDK